MNEFETRIKGAIIGLLVGDALGFPYQNNPNIEEYEIQMVQGLFGENAGCWQSPGSFSLALISSINEMGRIDYDDIMDKFLDVYLGGHLNPDGDCKDISHITGESLKNYTNGLPIDRCGSSENNDSDCLFRMLPIALYFSSSSIDIIVDQAHKICAMTHADIENQTCCAALCLMYRNTLLQKAEKVFDTLDDFYKVKELADHRKALANLKAARYNGKTHNTFEMFWSAWSAYSSHETDFESAIKTAIYRGNDTNGRAAIVGSISGMANGLEQIPENWQETLMLGYEARDIIDQFTNTIVSKLNQFTLQ